MRRKKLVQQVARRTERRHIVAKKKQRDREHRKELNDTLDRLSAKYKRGEELTHDEFLTYSMTWQVLAMLNTPPRIYRKPSGHRFALAA